MKHLPLYPDRRQPLDRSEALTLDSNCSRCPRSEGARTVCMGADVADKDRGAPIEGGVLVVGAGPTRVEDNTARPFSAPQNRALRKIIEETYDEGYGPVVYTNAVNCWKDGRKKTVQKEIDACRPYLRGVFDEVKPERILCFGKEAFWSVLGVESPPQHARRGYGHLADGTPVFMLAKPGLQLRNRFLSTRFKKDVEWALSADPDPAPFGMMVEVIETAAEAEAAADVLRAGAFWTYDTETAGLIGSEYFGVVCLAAVPESADRVFVWDEASLQDPRLNAPLVELLKDPDAPKVGHNLKYDIKAAAHGIPGLLRGRHIMVDGVLGDTLLWTKMLDTEVLGRLEYQANLVGMGGHKSENKRALIAARTSINVARGRPDQRILPGLLEPAMEAALRHPGADEDAFAYGLIERTILHRYCALDTVATARLALLLRPLIEGEAHHKLVNDVFIRPSTAALAQIESWGMSASADVASLAGTRLKIERDQAEHDIRTAGCTVENLGSTDQLAAYLFDELKLPVLGHTDGGAPSTKAEYLKPLKDKHPVIEPLLRRAKVDKLINTYADGLLPHILEGGGRLAIPGGRIYTNINQDGTRSGRWSSSNPNLQNIPSGGAYAKLIKSIFNAPAGHVLIQLDYSQLELRIAALLTGDESMIQIYKDGLDFHQRTAELIAPAMWGLTADQVTKEHRRAAKAFNFGVWYGQGDGTIAKNLNVSRQVAAGLRHEVLGQFEKAGPWIDSRKLYTRKHGVTWTYWDGEHARVRQLPDIASHDDYLASKASNGSFNTAVQGTAALFMERTIGAVTQLVLREHLPVRITNTVHDSIIIESPYEWVAEIIDIVKGVMEGWPSGDVPLIADAEVGMNWGSLLDFDKVKQTSHASKSLSKEEMCHLLRFTGEIDDKTVCDYAALQEHLDMAARLGV